jgi:putative FmdB family regulatory protein
MPTYEYECTECKHKFEVFQSMSDAPIANCEKCSGKVRKLFGKAGIIFKGSGFYVNDYKKKDTSSKPGAEIPSCAQSGSCPAGGCPAKEAV